MREFFGGFFIAAVVIASLCVFYALINTIHEDHSKLSENYGFADTLKTTFFLKNEQILEEKVKDVFPKFRIVKATPLVSGAFTFSSKIGTIYEVSLVKRLVVDTTEMKYVTTNKLK